jgi:hypothetical protein
MGRGVAVAAVLATGLVAAVATAGESPSAPGMRAYVDPATGKLTDRPPPGAAALPAASHSGVGLAETPAPGGGVMVHLQGRFQSPLVATVGPDGQVRVEHAPDGD